MPVCIFVALVKSESCYNFYFPVYSHSCALPFCALFGNGRPLYRSIIIAPSPHTLTQHPGLHELGVWITSYCAVGIHIQQGNC